MRPSKESKGASVYSGIVVFFNALDYWASSNISCSIKLIRKAYTSAVICNVKGRIIANSNNIRVAWTIYGAFNVKCCFGIVRTNTNIATTRR